MWCYAVKCSPAPLKVVPRLKNVVWRCQLLSACSLERALQEDGAYLGWAGQKDGGERIVSTWTSLMPMNWNAYWLVTRRISFNAGASKPTYLFPLSVFFPFSSFTCESPCAPTRELLFPTIDSVGVIVAMSTSLPVVPLYFNRSSIVAMSSTRIIITLFVIVTIIIITPLLIEAKRKYSLAHEIPGFPPSFNVVSHRLSRVFLCIYRRAFAVFCFFFCFVYPYSYHFCLPVLFVG